MAIPMLFSAPNFAADDDAQACSNPRSDLLGAFARFRKSSVPEIGLRAGDPVPVIVLKDAKGRHRALSDDIRRGPVVLVFDAGPWNPSRDSFYEALLRVEPEIQGLGGTLVLISSASPRKRDTSAKSAGGGVVQLIDLDSQIAALFGVVAPVPDELRAMYADEGYYTPSHADEAWCLPLSATYVIDGLGSIAYSSIGEPELLVSEPTEVVTILRCLKSRSPAA